MSRRPSHLASFIRFCPPVLVCGAVLLFLSVGTASAQQANVGVPFGQANSGFFEQSAVGFSFNGPNFFFRQNSFGLAIPQFGGYTPDAGAAFGFGTPLGDGQASFNFAFGQGSQTSLTSSAPSMTIGNGGFGSMSAGSWSPFVVGQIPVVGDAPGLPGMPFGGAGSTSLLQERLGRIGNEPGESAPRNLGPSTVRDDPSIDPFRRQLAKANAENNGAAGVSVVRIEQLRATARAAEAQSAQVELDRLVEQGESALAAGKARVARVYFQQAERRASGAMKVQLRKRMDEIAPAPRVKVGEQ